MLHGYCPPERHLPSHSWTQIAALPNRAHTETVLPAGSIEQHGPYLPCAADSVIAATVAAAFQKDPQVLVGHPGVVNKMEDLKGKTILISSAAHTTCWPRLMATCRLEASQARPYTSHIQPLIADKNVVRQGYLSSEPYAIEKAAKGKPDVFLLSDHGWPPCSTTIVGLEKTVRERPKAVAAFVKASMEGWRRGLAWASSPTSA
ncbi:MAG: hypothetical protein RL227_2176 [Pseudomonadota bacterium]|jgi:NitT/TauT family transport system substrate-binding protein